MAARGDEGPGERVRLYLTRSEQALDSAILLVRMRDFGGACNRAYFSMFNAVRAAMLSRGSDGASKTHRTLVGRFCLEFVRSGELSVDLGRHLIYAREARERSDYSNNEITRNEALEHVQHARDFLGQIQVRILRGDVDLDVLPEIEGAPHWGADAPYSTPMDE